MGIERPTLRDLVRQAAPVDRAQHGAARAKIFCHHAGNSLYLVGEVRGVAVMGTVAPHDQAHDLYGARYSVYVSCTKCGRVFELDLPELRRLLGLPGRRPHKINVRDVVVAPAG